MMLQLKTPVPADLVPILAKDEAKQQEIANRKPVPSVAPSSSSTALKPASTHTSPNPQAIALKGPSVSNTQAPTKPTQAPVPEKKASAWALPTIPAFDPQRAAAARAAKAAAAAAAAHPAATAATSEAKPAAAATGTPATKFNVAAKEFVFRPTAGSFVPGGAAAAAAPVQVTAAPSPAAPTVTAAPLTRKASENPAPLAAPAAPVPAQPLNPFFGTRIIRNNNNAPFRVKEDFSPFKRNEKIPDPATVRKSCLN